METLAGIIRLKEYSTFSLFTSRKTLLSKASAAAKEGEGTEESVIIQDGVLVSDILSDFRESKSDPSLQCRIVFKKRMFRDTDEAITEPMFVNLSYLQAKHDFLGGNYPVGNDDSMQLAAFQIQAEEGNAMRDVDELANALGRFLPRAVLSNAPREELAAVVMSRHKLLLNHSKDDARLGLLTMIRALPYGGSIFFPVKRIEDPIGLLPGRIVLGINKRGIHFFRPVPMEYLHSAELRDIMFRPEMTDQVMANYQKGPVRQQRGGDETDERVTLEEFLAEVKKSFDVSAKVAEKMLFIYERTLRQRIEAAAAAAAEPPAAEGAEEEEAAPAPAEAPAAELPPPVLRNSFVK